MGDDEEITGSTLLKYYHIPALPVLGTIVGVTRTYLASDGLGSETVDLSYNGSVLAQSLYGPYGVGRYATGTMPSSKGYTGQRQDSGRTAARGWTTTMLGTMMRASGSSPARTGCPT